MLHVKVVSKQNNSDVWTKTHFVGNCGSGVGSQEQLSFRASKVFTVSAFDCSLPREIDFLKMWFVNGFQCLAGFKSGTFFICGTTRQ